MRRIRAVAAALCVAAGMTPCVAAAQEATAPEAPPAVTVPSPIVTLDQERFFRESAYGKAALARAEAEAAALSAENRKLEAALEAEERELTTRRATLKPEEFAPLSSAFDAKVEEIRAAQDAKSRAITRHLEETRQKYFESAVPVLAELLRDTGAVAILADNAIILSLSALDVTDEAVARMDLALPDLLPETPGEAGPDAPEDAPGPSPEPSGPPLQDPGPTPQPQPAAP
jgi:Skp family chaperone for outer membrane proteins